MKLIGAGLPRTGTLSQKVALEILGLRPCYHMVNVLADLDEVPRWREALERNADWQAIFSGFEATVDWPGAFFYAELADAYPDAKVLLSVRDADDWERSMRNTVWGVLYDDSLIRHVSSARAAIDPKWRGYLDLMKEMWYRGGLISQDGNTDDMSGAMERYNQEVQDTIPADRLLVWSVADGWEPLCEFLDLEVPDMPFPHLNDTTDFGERIIDGSLLTLQQWRAQEAAASAS